jgi:hypothetical protein
VSTYQDKITRLRLEEEQRKRDLALKTKEMEQLLKSERNARNRVEEIEEALRESTVALENARGEVEVLRAELTVSYPHFIWHSLNLFSRILISLLMIQVKGIFHLNLQASPREHLLIELNTSKKSAASSRFFKMRALKTTYS